VAMKALLRWLKSRLSFGETTGSRNIQFGSGGLLEERRKGYGRKGGKATVHVHASRG
jgi:hypothetical protein